MSFNIFLSLFFFIFICGCGVKSDPVPPSGTQLPSYVDKFLEDPEKTKEEAQKKDKKKSQP